MAGAYGPVPPVCDNGYYNNVEFGGEGDDGEVGVLTVGPLLEKPPPPWGLGRAETPWVRANRVRSGFHMMVKVSF